MKGAWCRFPWQKSLRWSNNSAVAKPQRLMRSVLKCWRLWMLRDCHGWHVSSASCGGVEHCQMSGRAVCWSLFKKGDQSMCASYRGITLVNQGAGKEDQANCRNLFRGTMWTSELFTLVRTLKVPESMPIWSTCASWTWRGHMTGFPRIFCGRCYMELGVSKSDLFPVRAGLHQG